MNGLAEMMKRSVGYVLWNSAPVRGHIRDDGTECYLCKRYFELVDACPLRMFPPGNCRRCGHSYAQHSKGPVTAKYCRHCPCTGFTEQHSGEQ